MLICLAAECTATYSLTKYEALQTNVEALSGHAAHLYNNDLIDSEIVTIVFCVMVATVFGTDFFFLLFFPRRTYPKIYNRIKLFLSVIITLGVLCGALASSVVVARNSAKIIGVDETTAQQLTAVYYRPPLKYNVYSTNIAYVVLVWLGFICTAASTVVMYIAVKHDERFGAEPKQDFPADGEK